jgi:DNA-binding Lrp family transcriptional regulator
MNGHHLKLLKELSKDNKLSQRALSRKFGLSLGSVNYVLSNLVDAGYIYILTPTGIKSRIQLSPDFLKRKEEAHILIGLRC